MKQVMLLGATVAVLVTWAMYRSAPAPTAASSARGAPEVTTGIVTAPAGLVVETARVTETAVPRRTRIQGHVIPAPHGEITINAPAPGFVSYPTGSPQVGQRVRRGDTLAEFQYHFELHDAVHLLNERWVVLRSLLQAERERVRTHIEFQRVSAVAEAEGASRAEVLAAQTAWRVADAEAQAWTKRLELHDQQIQASEPNRQALVSPLTGIVADVRSPHGQLAHEGDRLITVVDLREVWVEGTLSVEDAWIAGAPAASVVIPGSARPPLTAERRAVVPTVDGETRTLRVQFAVPNPDTVLRFGMSVDLFVDRGEDDRALTVPAAAVLKEDDRALVFLRVAPDRFERREVRVTADGMDRVPVEGLRAGDEVVIEGQQQLLALANQAPATGTPAGAPASTAVELSRELQQQHGVEVSEVERRPFTRTLALPGTVRPAPRAVAEVVSPIWGRIELAAPPVSVGDRVAKGQPLATVTLELNAAERHLLIDRTLEVEGALEQARARAELARDEHQRALVLQESNAAFAREAEWREEAATSAAREEALVSAQMDRQQTVAKIRDPNRRRITAPIGGTVMQQHFVFGQLVPEETYQPLFTIIDLRRVWVEADVFERDVAALDRVEASTVRIPSADEPRAASLIALGARVDPETRRLPAWFALDNLDGALRPGLPVTVDVVAALSDAVITVPSGAVVADQGLSYVFVATSPTRFERRAVQAGRAENGRVEILRGLSAKARVATRGVYYLKGAPPGSGDGHSHPH